LSNGVIRGASFEAAATFVTGGVWIDQYQSEINDVVRRHGVFGQRIKKVQATGALSRWLDQTAIGTAAFDNRTSLAPTATSPTRAERSVLIKAITNRIQFGLFEQEVSALPGQFQLKSKDLIDMVSGIVRLNDKALWQGTDVVSGAQVGDGTTNQYVGIPKQISTTLITVAEAASIVDAIRLEVAKMLNDSDNDVKPTAVYINPIAYYLLETEMKQASGGNTIAQVEVVAGVKVNGIMTAAGFLPLIPDVDLTVNPSWGGTPDSGKTHYPFVIVTEDLIEYHYVGSPTPRVFQLGTVSNLQDDYVGVLFGAPVVKLANLAHKRGVIVRTTV
jgi:putative ubiquitin-RnfH superfamily antitoxin RatB of RatAB toxin-antitoxin module